MSRIIKASEFKTKCLALMDEVERTGQSVVITKKGKPVAELVPLRPRNEECPWHLEGPPLHHWRYYLADRCRMERAEVILLDTHAAIWFTTDSGLGKRSQAIADHALADDRLAISAVSFWEISMLVAKRQRSLPPTQLCCNGAAS
jgi:prevent-host-death family protein